MPEENITTRFVVDISDLKTGITEANKNIKLANAEFKAASSGMDNWAESADGLEAKLKQLQTVLNNEVKKLKSYKDQLAAVEKAEQENAKRAAEAEKAYQQAAKQYGENSKEAKKYAKALKDIEKEQGANKSAADKLKVTILNQQAAVNKTAKEMRGYKKALDGIGSEANDASTASKKVEKALKDVDDSAEDAEGGIKKLGDGFTVLKGTMANLIASGVKSFISGMMNMAEETKEFRRELALLEQNTAGTGNNFEDMKDQLKEVTAITDDSGAAVEGLSNVLAAGFSGDALDKITDQLVGASIKWKDTLKFEGLADGLQETLATGSAVGPFAEMLERAGVNLETFDKGLAAATTSADKQNYVLSELSKLGLADVKKGYEDANKGAIDAANAQFELTDKFAQLGAKAEPVITAVKQGVADILGAFISLTEGINGEEIAGKIGAGFQYFIDEILPKIKEGFQWIIDNKDILIAGIVGIAAAMATMNVANIIMGLVKSFKAFKAAQEGATVAQWLLNAAMAANPIGLIVAAIVGLVAAFATLWVTSEDFRNFWIGLWDSAKKVFMDTWNAVVKFFTKDLPQNFNKFMATCGEFIDGVVSYFRELPSKIWVQLSSAISKVIKFGSDLVSTGMRAASDFLSSVINFAAQLPGKIWGAISGAISQVAQWGRDMVSRGRQAASDLVSTIVNTITSLPGKMASIGSDIVRGLWNGISDMVGWIGGKIQGFGEGVLSGIKNFFGIASPSKLMEKEVGKFIPPGIAVGIEKNVGALKKSMVGMAKTAVSAASGAFSTGKASLFGATEKLRIRTSNTDQTLRGAAGGTSTIINNYNQTINSPKALNRWEIKRQSQNLLALVKG